MYTRLLCVGDIHLGRRPSRVPADLTDYGVEPSALTPAAAWRRVVEVAIEQGVDAVVLAGDVVESDNQFFEAYGPLRTSVDRLVAAGIPVVAVAGNHDVEVLPRLADEVPGFTLIGRDGVWERLELGPKGKVPVAILGWSFREKVVRDSPLRSVPRAASNTALIGLLHYNLNIRASAYAPVTSAKLTAAPGDGWLLGHIHSPSAKEGAAPRGYLGNLSPLDCAETGERGAWILEVRGRGDVSLTRLRIAPLRWEIVEIDVASITDPDEIEGAITRAIHATHARILPTLGETKAVGCRVRLVGESACHRALIRSLAKKDPASLRSVSDNVAYFVESVRDDARQAIDLAEVAKGHDPPGLLAQMLLDIEQQNEQGRQLIINATAEIQKAATQTNWVLLGALVVPETATRQHLRA